jgi:hypothetical protein
MWCKNKWHLFDCTNLTLRKDYKMYSCSNLKVLNLQGTEKGFNYERLFTNIVSNEEFKRIPKQISSQLQRMGADLALSDKTLKRMLKRNTIFTKSPINFR